MPVSKFYEGMNPLVRVHAVRQRMKDAAKRIDEAVDTMIGDELDYPGGDEGWGYYSNDSKPSFKHIKASNGFGICGQAFLLHTSRSSGHVEHEWKNLPPDELLKTIEEIEAQVDAAVKVADEYVAECQRISAQRMANATPVLMKLCGRDAVVARLRAAADSIEGSHEEANTPETDC